MLCVRHCGFALTVLVYPTLVFVCPCKGCTSQHRYVVDWAFPVVRVLLEFVEQLKGPDMFPQV